MIFMITGKPRGGKSLRAVQLLAEELEHGNRPVVTNLALKLDELQEYLHGRGCRANVFDRVTVLDADQVQRFWRYRGYGVVLSECTTNGAPVNLEPYYTDERLQGGTFYALDELHLTFNSRWWQKVTGEAVWYFSQHGKLHDDIIGVAQRLGSVEVQFRELAQEYRFIRNYRMEKWGKFRAGDGFEETVYYREPGKNAQAAQVNKFKLDVAGIAACYSTQAGVGICDRAAGDGGHKVKGLPFWVIYGAIAVGFVGLWLLAGYVPKLLRHGLGAVVAGPVPEKTAVPESKGSATIPTTGKDAAGAAIGSQASMSKTTAPERRERGAAGATPNPSKQSDSEITDGLLVKRTGEVPALYVRGVVMRRGSVNVLLSDGSTLTEQDGIRVPGAKEQTHAALAAVRRNFVDLKDGTRLHFFEPVRTVVKVQEPAKAVESPATVSETTEEPNSVYLSPDRNGVEKLRHPPKLGEPISFDSTW
jgi:hypothetical protein